MTATLENDTEVYDKLMRHVRHIINELDELNCVVGTSCKLSAPDALKNGQRYLNCQTVIAQEGRPRHLEVPNLLLKKHRITAKIHTGKWLTYTWQMP
jgi:hypothetical protein